MTLRQAQHAPTGAYPAGASTVLSQELPDPEVYDIVFALEGGELGFSGVYTYQNNCEWAVTGTQN